MCRVPWPLPVAVVRPSEERGLETRRSAGRYVRPGIADVDAVGDAEGVERVVDVIRVGFAPLVTLERGVSTADDVEVEPDVVGDERGCLVAVVGDEADRRPFAEVANRIDIVVGAALPRPEPVVGSPRGVRFLQFPEPVGIDPSSRQCVSIRS